MKRRIITAMMAGTASSILLTGITNSAYAIPPAPSCSSNMCTWDKKDYKGSLYTSALFKGTCYLDVRVRSLVNKKKYNVRYYPDKNCASDRHYDDIWGYYDLEAQTGWAVYSYKRIS
ncbi:peptidase inhibitor family I36 protein [Streptomyces sp. NPDC050508]|uniref:peptidase inhibitor family I36 protein n=1 Tax=Streptomyces sp. NPDC050508 TaxID=3155405 RepID=UPI00342921DB